MKISEAIKRLHELEYLYDDLELVTVVRTGEDDFTVYRDFSLEQVFVPGLLGDEESMCALIDPSLIEEEVQPLD